MFFIREQCCKIVDRGGKMKRNPLIGISIIAMVFLVLGSLSNMVGYQIVQDRGLKRIILYAWVGKELTWF